MGKISMGFNMARSIAIFMATEFRRGTLLKNLPGISRMELAAEMSWGELLEEKAAIYGDKPYLLYGKQSFSYRQMNANANRLANYLHRLGGGQGKGVAIFMDNSPRVYDVIFGLQKIGMYAVPVNTSLRGDGMLYILNHCDAEFLVIDEAYTDRLERIQDQLTNIRTIIVNPAEEDPGTIPANQHTLDEAYQESPSDPGIGYNKDDICIITYTSGTTGLPKGVVYRYRKSGIKLFSLISHILWRQSDIMYTCMPLFHANALLVTSTSALHVGATVALDKKFSASRFWESIRRYDATTFNTIGAMIPILLKQPEKPTDNQNRGRCIISAACTPALWQTFEKRYGIRIYETYGSVDGGGKTIMNLGTAPVGSIGKPTMKIRYRLVDDNMNDVADGEPGELIFPAPRKKAAGVGVEYYKNEKATSEKQSSDWIRTGDVMRRDKKGYLYFVGRNTESMRIKGENVSAYEVEQILQKHPAILEAAVYAVPSELAEDEIMCSLTLVEGSKITEAELVAYAADNLAKFAVPRYVRIVDEFEKTETHRIKKKPLEAAGVVPGTYDASRKAFRTEGNDERAV